MARILVVDDEPDLRLLLRRLLENAGYEVDEAGDGHAALTQLRAVGHDVVVTDDAMPRMSGRELLSAIRQERDLDPRIVVWADNPDPGLAAEALFVKPYGGPALVERVRQLLEKER